MPDAVTSDSGADGPIVVGVGASAGGLAALELLFQAIPADTGLAFVVVVHLPRDRESFLAEVMQPGVAIPVTQVSETTPIEPDHVYVIPPGRNLDTIDTHLRLTEFDDPGRQAPIDHFFRTLAATHAGRAVGIVLTGTGSDGALGVRAIRERGGLTIVQDPRESEFDGMPQAAIASGAVDLVLPLGEIIDAVLRFERTKPIVSLPDSDEELRTDDPQLLARLFAWIQSQTGRDFSRYKRATIMRRIQRRMQLRSVERLDRYVELLRDTPEEVAALSDDLLVTVSSFFRDPEVFDALATDVIPRLFDAVAPDAGVRVWSQGCATGEEAYSLAILLLEEAARRDVTPRLRVFASDLHPPSLTRAREGIFSGDIAGDVGRERLARWFRIEEGGYRVREIVREIVVFAEHDLLVDPPFSQLDLISCRNLLIYLDRDIQRDVAEVFHCALRPGGFLVLGSSESLDADDLFVEEGKRRCIYRARDVEIARWRLPTFPVVPGRRTRGARRETTARSYEQLHRKMIGQPGPARILVGPDDRIMDMSDRAGRYLLHRTGSVTNSVLKVIRDEFVIELQAALHEMRAEQRPTRTQPVTVTLEGTDITVTLSLTPAMGADGDGFALIVFEEAFPVDAGSNAPDGEAPEDGDPIAGDDAARIRRLADQRDLARERLRTLVEEFETSEEELRASNEELQSANEELRSTLEELETSKEELQSMNEELQTVVQENRHQVEELSQLSGDLQNLLAATDIATLFLDRELRIVRFTPAVTELFDVRTSDRRRPISDLTHRLGYEELTLDAGEVLRRLVPVEREVRDDRGRWYLTRLHPYRTTDDRIDGVVITFVDITTNKEVQAALRASEQQFRATTNQLPLLVWKTDEQGALTWANDTYCAFFGKQLDRAIGDLWQTVVHPDDRAGFADLLERAHADHADFHTEVRVLAGDGAWTWLELWAQAVVDASGEFTGHLGTSADVSDRKRAEGELRAAAEQAAVRAELLDVLRRFEDPIEVQAAAARVVGRHLDAARVYYATVDDTASWGTVEADYSPDMPSVVGRHRLDGESPVVISPLNPAGLAIVVDVEQDVRSGDAHRAATKSLGIRSYVIVPLVRAGRTVATMVAQGRSPRSWTPHDVVILEEALTRTWSAVERSRAEALVRLGEARLRHVLDAVPSVLFTTDADGRVDLAIGQVEAILGAASADLTGTVLWPELIHQDERDDAVAGWERARGNDESFDRRYRVQSTGRWVLVRAVPIRDDAGTTVRWFGTVTDVDALTTAERELAEVNATLEDRVAAGTERVRQLAASLSRAEHEERRRIGQILHDDLQQYLYAMQLKLDTARAVLADGDVADADARLVDAGERLARAIDITRTLSVDLSPPLLDGDTAADALSWLVSYMAELHGLTVTVEASPSDPFDDDFRVLLFQIARELLFNVAKHADTDRATVTVRHDEDSLVLTVSDHGQGFDPGEIAEIGGTGLLRVRERLQLLAGRLDIVSAPGDGCTVTAHIPTGSARTIGAGT